jgi:isopenicillin N synthase-like dioxygenase
MLQLLDCLSLALNLSPADSLGRYHAGSFFNYSLLHYPALSAQLLRSGSLTRIPAHSDFGTLTLLFQDQAGGLEIAELGSASTDTSAGYEKSGRFRHVEPKPKTVIVNVGYLLMRWSNGRWKNTVHRVSEPPSPLKEHGLDESGFQTTHGMNGGNADEVIPARYSIPFFASPDPATIVEALQGCCSEEVPKRWKPINAGDYLRRKRGGAYA